MILIKRSLNRQAERLCWLTVTQSEFKHYEIFYLSISYYSNLSTQCNLSIIKKLVCRCSDNLSVSDTTCHTLQTHQASRTWLTSLTCITGTTNISNTKLLCYISMSFELSFGSQVCSHAKHLHPYIQIELTVWTSTIFHSESSFQL